MRRRWRVKVDSSDYGRVAVVYLTRKGWLMDYGHASDGNVIVGSVSLQAENADQRLSEMRAKAKSYATQLQNLET